MLIHIAIINIPDWLTKTNYFLHSFNYSNMAQDFLETKLLPASNRLHHIHVACSSLRHLGTSNTNTELPFSEAHTPLGNTTCESSGLSSKCVI